MRARRKVREITQEDLAAALAEKQAQGSRIEKRKDANVSTLERHIEATSADPVVPAKVSDARPIKITGFTDV